MYAKQPLPAVYLVHTRQSATVLPDVYAVIGQLLKCLFNNPIFINAWSSIMNDLIMCSMMMMKARHLHNS